MPTFRIATVLAIAVAAIGIVACGCLHAETARDWRLVQGPNPLGGPDIVSIMQPADAIRSDMEMAGLILRCSERGFDLLIVLIDPLPPRVRPRVTFTVGETAVQFDATIAPPGAMILLPADASALLTGPWLLRSEVAVAVDTGKSSFRGIVSLQGLRRAYETLIAACTRR